MDTQTQIDRLIELAIVQRAELKKLVSELPQLREHLNAEIERVFESTEPQLRTELEDWTTKQAHDQTVKLGGELEAKIVALSKSLEATTQTRYNAIMAERAENLNLLAKAEARIEDAAAMLSGAVKEIVTDELARFPRAGEIDQLRKEFAEPRGLNPRGRWEPGATYYKLDLVAYNGDSYVANEETSEKPNRNSSKWTLNAARGQAGGGGFMSPAIGDYTASMITNVPAGVITSTNVQDAINELAADVDVSQNTLDALVTNADSVTITKGQVVYAFGSVGNRMSVKLALNTGDATSSKTIGVVLDSSIAAGATGNIRCVGVVDGLTLGSYTEGDVLYLGATAGSVTATKPYAPNHLVYVGIVERANNGNGELYVKIQNGYELDEIHDVQITSAPLAGALLMRDATNSLWKANRLTGTTNQVTVTNADTAVTLSLPTSLASVDSITASASTALTLTGGSTGASLVLGALSASNASATLETKGTGGVSIITVNPTYSLQISAPTVASYFPLALSSGVIGTIGNTVGVRFGFTGTTYQKGAIIYESTSSNGVGKMHFAMDANENADNAVLADSKVAITSTGNLLIGTTTDAASLAGGLIVNGSGAGAAASSTVTGALRVTGGVGVSGAGYFGGAVTVLGAAAITGNAATGKLISVGTAAVLSSYWDGTNGRGIQIGTYSSLSESETSGALSFNSNAVLFDSVNENSAGSYKRMDNGGASRIRNLFGTISLDTAVSSTPGSTITWVPQLTVSATATTFAGAVTIAGTVIHTLSATPASASATGTVGTMSWDANYIYICTATNTWKRVAIATW